MAWYRLAAVIAIATASVAVPVCAQDRGAPSARRWQAMDNCNKDAFTHYPDYTVEGAAQREAFVRKCLRDQRLPAWSGYGTPQTKP